MEKTQQTEAEKAAETVKKLQEAESAAEALRHENAVIKAGVNADDVDYVLFKVGKMEGANGRSLFGISVRASRQHGLHLQCRTSVHPLPYQSQSCHNHATGGNDRYGRPSC